MKLTAFLASSAATGTILVSGAAHASLYEFELRNASSERVISFHATNTGTPNPGPDLLGPGTLRSGRSIMIDPDDGSGRCRYDLLAAMQSGRIVARWNVNLCTTTRFTIYD